MTGNLFSCSLLACPFEDEVANELVPSTLLVVVVGTSFFFPAKRRSHTQCWLQMSTAERRSLYKLENVPYCRQSSTSSGQTWSLLCLDLRRYARYRSESSSYLMKLRSLCQGYCRVPSLLRLRRLRSPKHERLPSRLAVGVLKMDGASPRLYWSTSSALRLSYVASESLEPTLPDLS